MDVTGDSTSWLNRNSTSAFRGETTPVKSEAQPPAVACALSAVGQELALSQLTIQVEYSSGLSVKFDTPPRYKSEPLASISAE